MRRRAALLVLALVGLSGCTQVSSFISRQYAPAQPRFVIFYSPWSSTLDETGRLVAASAARLALTEPASTIQVVGFASTVGADDANQTLSESRAQAVETQLIADGVDASRVTSMARGATTYQFSPLESRRVEIDVVKAGF
jgi:outer membrane protein OmpA-like peptidoglycan-associated protein